MQGAVCRCPVLGFRGTEAPTALLRVVELGTASGKSGRDVPLQRTARQECDTWGWASHVCP